jgi:hypothetical protein
MAINNEIHTSPESAHAGGFVEGDVRSWYNEVTTFGMRVLIMMR